MRSDALSRLRTRYFSHTDRLVRNSVLIMLSSIGGAGFGFIFWFAAARYSQSEDVGMATALVSAVGLIIAISRFGLDFSLIRFIPEGRHSKIFSTSFSVATSSAVVVGCVFVLGVDYFSPELDLLKNSVNAMIFLSLIALSSVVFFIGVFFIATKRPGMYLLQNVILGSRILFLIPLMSLGAMGIFSAVGCSLLLMFAAAILSTSFVGAKPLSGFNKVYLRESLRFSAGNYVSALFMTAPSLLLPLLVLDLLGPQEAAYYYIAFVISSALFIIPSSIGTSLFVEGSHGASIRYAVRKSLAAIFMFLLPLIVFLLIFGEPVLSLFGTDYSHSGLSLLRLMTVASLPVGLSSVFFTVVRIRKEVKSLMFLSALVGLSLTILSYFFVPQFGIDGVGYAWILSYGAGSAASIGLVGSRVLRRRFSRSA